MPYITTPRAAAFQLIFKAIYRAARFAWLTLKPHLSNHEPVKASAA